MELLYRDNGVYIKVSPSVTPKLMQPLSTILSVCRGHEDNRNEEMDMEMSYPSGSRVRGQQAHVTGTAGSYPPALNT